MKVIGLTGFAKSGKSTAAQILKEMGGQEVAFAKHLKDVCSVVFGIERDAFDNQAKKEVPFQIGIMQSIMPNPIILNGPSIEEILHYFEVSPRFVPEALLKHVGTKLTSPRHVAQYIGTELLRSIDENIHIKMAFKLNENTGAKFLICSDVRFANEMEAVRKQGGIVVGISRKSVAPNVSADALHPSEREIPALIDRSNFVAHNETTIEEFQDYVKSLASTFLKN